MSDRPIPDGFLPLLKPPAMTSHDVVAHLRRRLGVKKIGHTGTLDPGAAGVLLLALGSATRLVEYLQTQDKSYLAEVRLGVVTSTQDAWGEVLEKREVNVGREDIEAAVLRFLGEITQVPPRYSAIKVGGVPLYRLARCGKKAEAPKRTVRVNAIRVLEYRRPILRLFVDCSSGTYIRTLAHDLGQVLGCGGCLDFLVRTRVGKFGLENCCTIEEAVVSPQEFVRTPTEVLSFMPQVRLPEGLIRKLAAGQRLPLRETGKTLPEVGTLLVTGEDRRLAAVASVKGSWLLPKKVFTQ